MRTKRAVLLALVLATAACTEAENDGLEATGTVELTETDIAAPVAARVRRIVVEEGDAVAPGDTLVVLEQTSLPADLEQRRARVSAAEAELRDLVAGSRATEIERAEAELVAAEAEARRTTDDARRYAELLKSGAASPIITLG